ncbi:MAG: hypothetical protein AAGB48_03755 [Planctomycetota bacterium]
MLETTAVLAQIHHGDMVPIIAISVGGTVALIAIIFGGVVGIVRNVQTETSRREIAAYVAEGSMTPEEGERLLKAKPPGKDDA